MNAQDVPLNLHIRLPLWLVAEIRKEAVLRHSDQQRVIETACRAWFANLEKREPQPHR